VSAPAHIPKHIRDAALAEIRWLSLRDVCKIMGCGEDKAHDLRRRGLLPLVMFGKRWRITRKAWDRAERDIIRQLVKQERSRKFSIQTGDGDQ